VVCLLARCEYQGFLCWFGSGHKRQQIKQVLDQQGQIGPVLDQIWISRNSPPPFEDSPADRKWS
jgi:hypothetical protein